MWLEDKDLRVRRGQKREEEEAERKNTNVVAAPFLAVSYETQGEVWPNPKRNSSAIECFPRMHVKMSKR